jgi:hypothetical protein
LHFLSQTGTIQANCFKLKNKVIRYDHNQSSNNNNGKPDRENCNSQDMIFTAFSKNENFTEYIWICDSGACRYYYNSSKGLFKTEEIKASITVVNGKSMKFRVIQVDDSGLDITLHKFKFVPILWITFSVLA